MDRLYQSHTLDPSKRAIYQYGTELTLSTSAAVFSILLLAVLFGNWIWGALFLIVNIPPQTGQQNGGNRSRVTVEMSPGVRLQVQAVE